MSNCVVKDCHNPAVAHSLCRMHYMRQRRTGNTATTFRPGPRPKPHPAEVKNAKLRKEIARLRQQLAEARGQPQPAAVKSDTA